MTLIGELESLMLPGGEAHRMFMRLPGLNEIPDYQSIITIIHAGQDYYILVLSTPVAHLMPRDRFLSRSQ